MKKFGGIRGGLIGMGFGLVILILIQVHSLQNFIGESFLFFFPTAYASVLLSFIFYFLGGVILGFIYDKIPYKKSFVLLLLLSVLIGAVLTVVVFIIPSYKNYSEQDCEKNNFFVRWNEFFDRTECYQSVAYINKKPDICEKITNKNQQGNCYKDVAPELRSHVLCQKISNKDDREQCYVRVAVKLKSYEICQKVSNEVYKDQCVSQIAEMNGGCEILSIINSRDYCYLNQYQMIKLKMNVRYDDGSSSDCEGLEINNKDFCKKLKDHQINSSYFCEKIIDQKLKQRCYNY